MPKKTFLFLHRSAPRPSGPPEAAQPQQPPPSPAQMQEMFAAFEAWKQKFKAEILDLGGKLGPTGKVVTSSGVTDGPFVEVKEIVGGYMLVSADSYEEAVRIAQEGPGMVRPGASVEIRELSRP